MSQDLLPNTYRPELAAAEDYDVPFTATYKTFTFNCVWTGGGWMYQQDTPNRLGDVPEAEHGRAVGRICKAGRHAHSDACAAAGAIARGEALAA